MKIDFPLGIEICQGEEDHSAFSASLHRQIGREFVVLTGASTSYFLATKLMGELNLEPKNIIKVMDNSIQSLEDIIESLGKGPHLFLAIGGGKVCDVGKRIAYILGATLILYPTIVSNDGLLSPIAVMSEGDLSLSLPGKMPDHVYIDLSVIRAAPSRFLKAAAFDLLSNISATEDWQYASEQGERGLNHLAFQLSRMAANQLLDCVSWDFNSAEFMRAVINGQILSGISMAYAGSSRPCSGSEHLLSHSLDQLHLGSDILHGFKVGRATLFTTYLQGKSSAHMCKFFKALDTPLTLIDEDLSSDVMLKIFQCSRNVRPGRQTILDEYSDKELLHSYRKFQEEIL